jgi:hypothetical protein
MIIARDPEVYLKFCFVEHLEAITHHKDGGSLQIARGAQHPVLGPDTYTLSSRRPQSRDTHRTECVKKRSSNCREPQLQPRHSRRRIRAHLDEEGDSRHIHICQICDKDFRVVEWACDTSDVALGQPASVRVRLPGIIELCVADCFTLSGYVLLEPYEALRYYLKCSRVPLRYTSPNVSLSLATQCWK